MAYTVSLLDYAVEAMTAESFLKFITQKRKVLATLFACKGADSLYSVIYAALCKCDRLSSFPVTHAAKVDLLRHLD